MLLRPIMLFLVATSMLAGQVYAHPGHAVETADPQSLTHYALHPDHLATWILLAAIAIGAWWIKRATTRRLAPAYARVRKTQR